MVSILNSGKTTSIAFHLNNRVSNRKLILVAQKINIKGDDAPKYLGTKFDSVDVQTALTVKTN